LFSYVSKLTISVRFSQFPVVTERQKREKDRWKCLQITHKYFTPVILSQSTLLCRVYPRGTPIALKGRKSVHAFHLRWYSIDDETLIENRAKHSNLSYAFFRTLINKLNN
jgi:hypothetical protein